jgi:hypothetical protein
MNIIYSYWVVVARIIQRGGIITMREEDVDGGGMDFDY